MKKILVTGADGFIGSHLTEALVRAGHDVRAFDPLQLEFEPNTLPAEVSLVENLQALASFADVLVLTHNDRALCALAVAAAGAKGRRIHVIDCWRILSDQVPPTVSVVQLGTTRAV